MEIVVSSKENVTKAVNEFLRDHGINKLIAFSGGADSQIEDIPKDDPIQAEYKKFGSQMETRVISDAMKMFQDINIGIITGGTAWGVPKTATFQAREYGLKTIAITPLAGMKHRLSPDMIDLSICVEPSYASSRWGDESSIFAKLLSGVIVFNGSAGTLVEVAHILKINEAIIDHKEGEPKIIVPITGTGGVADGMYYIWAKQRVKRICFPEKPIYNGSDAARYLIRRLGLNSDFKVEGGRYEKA